MENDLMAATETLEVWRPRRDEGLFIITLAIISLMAALDATILVPILPVGKRRHSRHVFTTNKAPDSCSPPQWDLCRRVLGRHSISSRLRRFSTFHRRSV